MMDHPRLKLFTADRIDFVIEGEDDGGRRCWRTYVGQTAPNGEVRFYLETLAYSPPTDWNELDGA